MTAIEKQLNNPTFFNDRLPHLAELIGPMKEKFQNIGSQ
jgi:hypothetical protein